MSEPRKKKSPDSLFSRFSIDIFWNIGSLIIIGCSGILINSLILYFRSPRSLGIFNLVFAFYIIVSQISVGGLQFSVLKHCSQNQSDTKKCQLITSAALLLVTLLSIVICLLIYGIRDTFVYIFNDPEVAKGIVYSLPGLLFYSLGKILFMALNGMRCMRAFAVFQSIRPALLLLWVGAIIIKGHDASVLLWSLSITDAIMFIILFIYLYKKVFNRFFHAIAGMKALLKAHFQFGLHGFMSGVLTEMNTRIDLLFLGVLTNITTVGIYSFAATFAEGFALLTGVMRRNVDPLIGEMFSRSAIAEIENFIRKIRKKYYLPMCIMGVIGLLVFPVIVKLVDPALNVHISWIIFAVLVFGYVAVSGYTSFIGLILQGGRPGVFSLLMLIFVCSNMALNLMFIPWMGIYGAALATVSANLFQALSVKYSANKLFAIKM